MTAEEVKELGVAGAWEKYPALKEAYEAEEEKETIVVDDGWGEKVDDFLTKHAELFAPKPAEGEAAAEPEKEPEKEPDPEKVIVTIDDDQVAEVAGDMTKLWKEAAKLADKTGLDKLGDAGFSSMLQCMTPPDAVTFSYKSCRHLHKKYGKPRINGQQFAWNMGAKYLSAWEKRMGGPRWDFPEGETTELDGPADEIVTAFVAQSKEGKQHLTQDIEIDVPVSQHPDGKAVEADRIKIVKGTYTAIVTRALKSRLVAKGLPSGSFKIELKGDEYKENEKNTFTVTTEVLGGTDEEVLKRANEAVNVLLDINSLQKQVKKTKSLITDAFFEAEDMKERADKLKDTSKGAVDVDPAGPMAELRKAVEGPLAALKEQLQKLNAKEKDKVFTAAVSGEEGEGKQVELRQNLARKLRVWMEAQEDEITQMVDDANEKLIDNSRVGDGSAHTTKELGVVGEAGKEMPAFLTNKDAIAILNGVFEGLMDASFQGAQCTATPGADDATVVWEVKMGLEE